MCNHVVVKSQLWPIVNLDQYFKIWTGTRANARNGYGATARGITRMTPQVGGQGVQGSGCARMWRTHHAYSGLRVRICVAHPPRLFRVQGAQECGAPATAGGTRRRGRRSDPSGSAPGRRRCQKANPGERWHCRLTFQGR